MFAEKAAIISYKKAKKVSAKKKSNNDDNNTEKSNLKKKQQIGGHTYQVCDKLKKILEQEDFEEYVIEAGQELENNAYNKNDNIPLITSKQLRDACKKYFIVLYGKDKKVSVSLTNSETPIYHIFSEYLEQLDEGKIESKDKPTEKTLEANRDSINDVQLLSYVTSFLKWSIKK